MGKLGLLLEEDVVVADEIGMMWSYSKIDDDKLRVGVSYGKKEVKKYAQDELMGICGRTQAGMM